MIATWSAETETSPVFTSGDPLLAFWQSISVQLDFLQAQVQIVLGLSRAQTSTGADLDTWMEQFNFFRLGSNHATGAETFLRLTPAPSQIVIPAGAIVQTVGGGTQYEVVADTNETSWSSDIGGYVLSPGQTTVTATVEALVGGSAANILANTLTQFGSSVPGIDQITNPAPITNGVDAESDADFRQRFILYLATLAKATRSAILAAALGVEQGLMVSLLENQRPNGTALLGSFTVVADDGSGDPPAAILSAIFDAVNDTRAFSVEPFVIAPTALQAAIRFAIHLSTGAVVVTVEAAVQNAVAAMVNALPPGGVLYASAVISTALSVLGVAAVNPSTVLINNSSSDLIPTAAQEVRTTVALIAVVTY